MVNGFGSKYEPSEKRLIPSKLLCYRMFRFRPRPGVQIDSLGMEWGRYTLRQKPRQNMGADKWQAMQEMAMLKGIEQAELYYGKNEWTPCLTAAQYGHVAYTSGEHEAECSSGMFADDPPEHHNSPKQDCTCGFWSYYTPDVVDIGGGKEWTSLAAVEVWGDVVLGTKGVRAQKMKIVGVMVPKEVLETENLSIVKAWNQVVAELKVPQYWNKAEFLLMHPPQDVSELLPKTSPAESSYDDGFQRLRVAYPFSWSPLPASPLSQWAITTTNSTMGTPINPRRYYTHGLGSVTYYKEQCRVCGFSLTSTSRERSEEALAKHILDTHELPVTEP